MVRAARCGSQRADFLIVDWLWFKKNCKTGKKVLDKRSHKWYTYVRLREEDIDMKTRGWYWFEDGTQAWFNGLNARERAAQEREHGKIIRFVHTA